MDATEVGNTRMTVESNLRDESPLCSAHQMNEHVTCNRIRQLLTTVPYDADLKKVKMITFTCVFPGRLSRTNLIGLSACSSSSSIRSYKTEIRNAARGLQSKKLEKMGN
jgi:hypothetical protein